MENNRNQSSILSRRNFMKVSAAIAATSVLPGVERIFAAGSDKIRVGIVGCGKRGVGAAKDCVAAAPNVELVAAADLFQDQIDWAMGLWQKEMDPDKLKVTPENTFVGFDAYQKLLATNVDIVLLTTSPHFRPIHLKAAVEAGKHTFLEKPVAVDPAGVRSVIASAQLAAQKNLGIVAGTQRRHMNFYRELMKRVHEGAIGDLVAGQCYWLGGDVGPGGYLKKRQPGWSDMEYQCRNWYFFTWLSGDHYVEQHIHNIDVMNWAFNTHPYKAIGVGGRQTRTCSDCGNIWDHFAVEYEYPNGARVQSMSRQIDGASSRISEHVVGTKGTAYTDGGVGYLTGLNAYKYEGENNNPMTGEHAALIESVLAGKPVNEGVRIAESTLTAIMGRMSAYTGRELKWDWVMNASKLDYTLPEYKFGDLPVEPVAVPGVTPLV